MKTKLFFMALIAAAAMMPVKAQSEPVKIELPPDQVINHFRAYNSGTAVVEWIRIEDGKDTYILGHYTIDGDAKKVVYRNNAYYCTETRIPLEYCPAKIRAAVDTLAPGFAIKDLYYETSVRNKGYRAVMQKGKRKKAEFRDLMFTPKGEFMQETDVKKLIRGF